MKMVPMPPRATPQGTDGGTVPFSPTEKNGGDIPETAIEFLQTLRVPEGPLAGKLLVLAEFQKRFIRGAMVAGVMVAVLSIGRGNAKTALAAGLGLGALMGVWDNQPKREIILAARNRDQAKTAFQFVAGFVEGLPEAEQELFIIRRGYKLEIEYSANGGGLLRVIPADGKSILGGAPTLAIMDERAAWERDKGDALENAILSGLGKRDGRALIISTSAPDDANTFSRWMSECSAHGLRKACARRLAEAGATTHEIMAVTGHKTLAEVQRYTETAMREGLADAAHAKLLSRPNREQTVVNLPARFANISPNQMKSKEK